MYSPELTCDEILPLSPHLEKWARSAVLQEMPANSERVPSWNLRRGWTLSRILKHPIVYAEKPTFSWQGIACRVWRVSTPDKRSNRTNGSVCLFSALQRVL